MSDSLGDGTGHPTPEQIRLYQVWANGGVVLSIIGEVQGTGYFPEKPGNLVLNDASDVDRFRELARQVSRNDTQLWLQLGHAGALAYAPTSAPKGPSAPDLPGLRCSELTPDEIEGGFESGDALEVVAALDRSSVDLIDISGGTYFPGAKSASDGTCRGPYFLKLANRARAETNKPLMLTSGFKTRRQAQDAIAGGAIDVVGLARALVVEPSLPTLWNSDQGHDPAFPRFTHAPEGGVTAWYTTRLTEIGTNSKLGEYKEIEQVIRAYEERDRIRAGTWRHYFTEDLASLH